MPGGDGSGPAGMGPMTGRAAGYCAGYPVPGYMNPVPGYMNPVPGGSMGVVPYRTVPMPSYPSLYGGAPYAPGAYGVSPRWGGGWGRGRGGGRGFGRGRGRGMGPGYGYW